MKNIFLIILVINSIALAQTSPTTPTPVPIPAPVPALIEFKSLREGMKDMSAKLKMISVQSADLAKQLAEAFKANDNAKVTDLLAKMSRQKKDGHSKFK